MKSRIKSLFAVAIVSFTASAARADVETSVRKSSATRPAAGASTAQARVPTTTDEARAYQIRQQAAIAARSGGQIVRHAPTRVTTTDEARAEAIYRQAGIAARPGGQVRRAPKRGYPTTTDEARGMY